MNLTGIPLNLDGILLNLIGISNYSAVLVVLLQNSAVGYQTHHFESFSEHEEFLSMSQVFAVKFPRQSMVDPWDDLTVALITVVVADWLYDVDLPWDYLIFPIGCVVDLFLVQDVRV